MAGISFNAFTGWANITDPNSIPPEAKILTAEDLMRYEKLGQDVAAWTAEYGEAPPGGGGGDVIDGGGP